GHPAAGHPDKFLVYCFAGRWYNGRDGRRGGGASLRPVRVAPRTEQPVPGLFRGRPDPDQEGELMGAINETELKRQLSQGQLSSLYVVRGEEKYLVSRWARRILKAAGGDSFPEFNRNE